MEKIFNLVEDIIAEEEAILKDLDIENILCKTVNTSYGLKQFAKVFYFVRSDFPTLNFIVGERCGVNEFLWSGLAKNLIEELGNENTPSHNQLYRDFLSCVGVNTEDLVKEPLFSFQFNETWRRFCRQAPLEEVLSAIAVYEIFDQPDYKLFLRTMQKAGVPEVGLKFFQVHAVAEHFEMFEDIVSWLIEKPGGKDVFLKGKEFVIQTQKKMWLGLIKNLQEQYQTVSL